MAFFEDLTKKTKDLAYVAADKAKDVAAVAADKAKDAAELTRISMAIAGEQREIDKNYRTIGEWFVSAAPLAWIDVAGYCSGRFAEGTLRDAQTKQWLAFLADKFGQSAPEVTPARLDGVTSANVDRSVLDAMAVAEDRAGFAIEVLAARGQTAGATLALSDMHKPAGQQLVALANGNFDDSGAQSSSSGQNDPRQNVGYMEAEQETILQGRQRSLLSEK